MGKPRDIADRMKMRRDRQVAAGGARRDGYLRESVTLPRDEARAKARDILDRYPAAAYGTAVEHWRELADGQIEFTIRRLTTAD